MPIRSFCLSLSVALSCWPNRIISPSVVEVPSKQKVLVLLKAKKFVKGSILRSIDDIVILAVMRERKYIFDVDMRKQVLDEIELLLLLVINTYKSLVCLEIQLRRLLEKLKPILVLGLNKIELGE